MLRKVRRSTSRDRQSGSGLETLEQRALLTNLNLSSLTLINGNGVPMSEPIQGEQIGLRATYSTSDITTETDYRVEFKVNDVPLSVVTNQGTGAAADGTFTVEIAGWYATAGTQMLEVALDADDGIAENDELDNETVSNIASVTAASPKFAWPLNSAVVQMSEFITSYADVDPLTGSAADFNGGVFADDGNVGWDIGPAHFTEQDAGIEVVAAAIGSVVEVNDGEFDRNTSGGSGPGNFVTVDHGNGYRTTYANLRRDSVMVAVGDAVAPGDVLGFLGSSGASQRAQLNFVLSHNGRPVEPLLDPAAYLDSTPSYSGDTEFVRSSGVTSYDPVDHFLERPSRVNVFEQAPNQDVTVWAQLAAMKQGQVVEFVWNRPDGSEFDRRLRVVPQDQVSERFQFSSTLDTTPQVGTWTVEFLVDGTKIGEESFEVQVAGGPEMLVEDDAGIIVVNNRYTPVDFGSAVGGGQEQTFTLTNHGTAALNITDVVVPTGFVITSSPIGSVDPGDTVDLTLAVDAGASGYFAGEVFITSNDFDTPVYRFSVEGTNAVIGNETLVLGLSERGTTESGGSVLATLRRTGALTDALELSITATPAAQLAFPASVTIPAGSDSATFVVDVVDDQSVEGSMIIELSAAPTVAVNFLTATNAIEVLDNDIAGFFIDDTEFELAESGTSEAFDVVLTARPLTDVVFSVTSSDVTEATVDVATLTFLPSNWDTPQTVTVTGEDDLILDGVQSSTVTVAVINASSDSAFSGLTDSVAVTTTDDEVAAIVLAPSGGTTVVSENGTSDLVDVSLSAEPAGDVVLDISTTDASEASAGPTTLTFDASNWDTPQQVTVVGIDDLTLDGSITSTLNVVVNDAASFNPYDGVSASTQVVTTDNDTAGITLAATGGSTIISEAGLTDTLGLSLDIQPISDVVLFVRTLDLSEVAVSPDRLTFTPANWNTPQTVNLAGVDDDIADGDISTTVFATVDDDASDPAFAGQADAVGVTNEDDDARLVLDGGNVQVDESGTSETFDMTLFAEPVGTVVLEVEADDLGEATVSPLTLTFDASNWDVVQQVTVTGADDGLVDGDQTSRVFVRVINDQSHSAFEDVSIQTTVVTVDDEVAGIVVADAPAIVREAGSADTVQVTLAAQPLGNVVVQATSPDVSEVATSSTRLTFSTTNWDQPQLVTVQGVDDVTLDGDQTTAVNIVVINSQSQDLFDGVVQPFDVVTLDDETASWTLEESDGTNIVDEAGLTDTFTIVLDAQPDDNVVLELVSDSDADEVAANPNRLTFTPTNWDVTRTVTIVGVDDPVVDGEQTATLTVRTVDAESSDPFDGLTQDLTVLNGDDDIAGIVLVESDGSTVAKEGEFTDSFDVTLNAQPLGDVVLEVTTSDAGQGSGSPSRLTFTSANWDTVQTVTVTATNDAVADGDTDITLTIAVDDSESHDQFDGLSEDLSVSILDDDPGLTVAISGLDTSVDESGTTDTFTVVLDAVPLGDVVVSAVSRDAGEASAAPTFLTFTAENWATPQTVTVTGVDDSTLDGTEFTTIDVSVVEAESAAAYHGLADIVTVSTTDDDTAGLAVVESGGNSAVSELGTTDTFTVSLTAQPLGNVVIDLTSSDTSEVTVSPSSITITPGEWDLPQTITLTGVDDTPVDGDSVTQIAVTVNDELSDDAFDGIEESVSVTNTDDEIASMTVTASGGSTVVDESGTTDDVSVVLDAQPTGPVVLDVVSTDTGEVSVSPTTITFTPINWFEPQIVTVTGVDDPTVDDSQETVLQFVVDDAATADAFDGLVDSSIQVVTRNDDVASFSIVESQCSTMVDETGVSDTFEVRLDRQPETGIVFFTDTNADDELDVSPAELTFTPENWDTPQIVTVTGKDDSEADSDGPFSVFVDLEEVRSDDKFDDLPRIAVPVLNVSDEAGFAAVDDTASTTLDTRVTIRVTDNDAPAPGARAVAVGTSPDGEVLLNKNGTVRFTPNEGFTGTASFDYEISEQSKIWSVDSGHTDEFGHAVATDGDLMVVGTPKVDVLASDSGAVFVYERTVDGNWSKIARVLAPDGERGDSFGYSVAIDGDTLVVGARLDDDAGKNAGAVYIFNRNLGGANNFGFVTKLTDTNGEAKDQFGHAVDIDGSTILVGARLDDDAGRNAGTAIVFDNVAGTWTQTAELAPATLAKGDQYGFDVAIDGDMFLVGARKSNELKTDAGSAYLFDRNLGGTDNFGIASHFIAADARKFDWFGSSVDIHGDTVAIGRPIRDGKQRTGEVHVFQRNEGGTDMWGQVAQVTSPDEADANQFGYSVALNDTGVYAGARLDQNISKNGGRVYSFDEASGWQLDRTISSIDSGNGDYFGQAIAVSNDTVFVAAPRDDDNFGRSGSVFIEELATQSATVTVTVTQPLFASEIGYGDVPTLTESQLDRAFDDAIEMWEQAGASQQELALLRSVSVSIVDWQDNQLGGAFGNNVLIDADAAGRGWSTSGYDLNTVVAHELGHVLGYQDTYDLADADDIMFGYLNAGESKTLAPLAEQPLDGVFADVDSLFAF
ncbi:MAG: peptidoglycan DD-metalloendopeptidase family protein [Planctomycetaceae bacterium]